MSGKKENIWNVPNVLTMIRLALIPVFWYLILTDHYYWAFGVFAVASLTDLADGFIARKYSLITDFGKLMDPLADKLMSLSVMLSLTIKGVVPWPAPVLLLLKEGTMVVGGLILYSKKVVVFSKWIGKLAQTVVVCSLLSCFFHQWIMEHWGVPVHLYLLWAGVALTLIALVYYIDMALKLNKKANERIKEENERV
ncbi:MAG: CDP-alcohol phosphatidyltransferase family protein [Clostridia bacterium]|nr:CDP-alcohol phosphatidyltransferase family protein [Clostridia bacterium]MBR3106090.1 CDP-alcohol phosphatidyltransferase family protein [Clostridia bacterium]